MHDIGTAMAGYNPDSRIVGWISVFVARLGRLLFFAGIRALRSQKSNAILIQDYGLKREKREEFFEVGQVSSSGASGKSLPPPR